MKRLNNIKSICQCHKIIGSMTLPEAIKHAKEVSVELCGECGKEHKQLSEWLEELVELRKRFKSGEK